MDEIDADDYWCPECGLPRDVCTCPSLASSTQFDGSKALMNTDAVASGVETPPEPTAQGRPDDHGSASRESDGKAASGGVPVSGEAESVAESLCDCGGIIKKGCDACNDCLNSFGDSAASVVIIEREPRGSAPGAA